MATRVTFAIADDNLLAGAADRSPGLGFKLAADRLFYDAIEQRKRGFETETQLVVYKRVPTYFKRMDAEAAFVVNLQHYTNDKTYRTETQIRDNGSYVKLNWYTKRNDYTGDQVSLTMFPFDSQRFLLGYTYNITWGGERTSPTTPPAATRRAATAWSPACACGTTSTSAPARTATCSSAPRRPASQRADQRAADLLRRPRRLRRQLHQLADPRGQRRLLPARLVPPAGHQVPRHRRQDGPARSAARPASPATGAPIGTSIDFQLFRNSPDATYLLTQTQIYDNRIAGSAAFEFTGVGQTLLDWEKPDTTVIRPASPARSTAACASRRPDSSPPPCFVTSTTSSSTSQASPPTAPSPAGAIVKPEWFVVVGVDYYLPKHPPDPGRRVRLQEPRVLHLQRDHLVFREFNDVDTLPQGNAAFDILSSKLTLKWDVAPFFVIVSELRYTLDNNRTKFVKSERGLRPRPRVRGQEHHQPPRLLPAGPGPVVTTMKHPSLLPRVASLAASPRSPAWPV
jgi:hypothetical protein